MKKKLLISLFALILSFIFVFQNAEAHSCRTDRLGGHFVSATGQ